ncbi:unknown [Sutterella wadsworthensis CAG:135]|nr:unknown [Sutterella wadsworthensis CAG:135]
MVDDCARQEHMINVAKELIDPDRRAERRLAEVLEVIRIGGDAVEHRQAAGNLFTDLLNHLFMRHRPVCAQREDDAHIGVGYAEAVEFIDEDWHEHKAVGNAGRIIADEGYGVAGLHNLAERREPDGVLEHVEQVPFDVFEYGLRLRAYDLQNVGVVVFKRLCAAAVGEHIFLQCHGSLLLLSFLNCRR